MTITTPNLFSFATSELSQDAFLCWIAALSRSEDAQLAYVGKSFLAWLWETAGKGRVEPEQVTLVRNPERQVERIDVLLHAQISGQPATFLIEDKTDTSHHSGQLGRYREAAEKRLPGVVPIYFKTGYHFDADQAAAEAGYTVITIDSWVTFLDTIEVKNDIIHQYRDRMRETLQERKDLIAALNEPFGYKGFGSDFVQFEFLRGLRDGCPNLAGAASNLARGTNTSGDHWTQLRFGWLPNEPPGSKGELLFHRIDRRDGGRYYLSTRQYADVKANPDARKSKLARLAGYRTAFRAAWSELGTPLRFDTPITDRKGKNESEIGVLFFDDICNTTRAVLEHFPLVHRAFVEKIRGQSG
jgi:hypothetical protein